MSLDENGKPTKIDMHGFEEIINSPDCHLSKRCFKCGAWYEQTDVDVDICTECKNKEANKP
jgi:hypothetical protein